MGEFEFSLRLFSLMWTHKSEVFFEREFVDLSHILTLFDMDLRSVELVDFTVSMRRKYILITSQGARIELNARRPLSQSSGPIVAMCSLCPYVSKCEEGYLGCGVRFASDRRIYPCLYRPDLATRTDKGKDGARLLVAPRNS